MSAEAAGAVPGPTPEPPRTVRPDEVPPGFERLADERPPGLARRLVSTVRHVVGLLAGGLFAYVRDEWRGGRRTLGIVVLAIPALVARPLLKGSIVRRPFAQQLRKRLELLGPTYIKLGQILALRADLLPPSVTDELKNLLDRLPVVTFERFRELVEKDLGRPIPEMFSSIEARPIGSASIAQIHRAWTLDGDAVVLKVVKPGIAETLRRDSFLLRGTGRLLQLIFPRYQPRRIIDEFCEYTEREVDLEREADNAETFRANFRDEPDIVFPKIFRELSSRRVLCMEFLDGVKPDDVRARRLTEAERQRLIEFGARAIVRMLYRDGFFHADLHPGNLMILPGARCGFIDLGMVGRFGEELRRLLLLYFYCLVSGDSENAARYLTQIAERGPRADAAGFRREVEEICRRWAHHPELDRFSMGELILRSVTQAARFGMYFPVEMVLMVKALITFEGVGRMLQPDIDVAKVTRPPIQGILIEQLHPLRVAREGLRHAPDVIDAIVRSPMLVTQGLKFLESTMSNSNSDPLRGVAGGVFAGGALVGGAIVVGMGGPAWLAAGMFVTAVVVYLFRGGPR